MRIALNELKRRVSKAYLALSCCKLCPRECGVNRVHDQEGVCHIGKIAKVASHNLHTGEEPPISGINGSGTIFFSSCNLRCKFCQNYPISQLRHGEKTTPKELAEIMLSLQKQGAHNINIVTGSHVVPQFLAGLYLAKEACHSRFKRESRLFTRGPRFRGDDILNIPIVWNSSGYDGMGSLKLLDGVIDIYMPDIKYSSNDAAEHYSSAVNYWDAVKPAIKEMHRQVGDLKINDGGIAVKGLLIRHLVLPNGSAGTEKVLKFIANEISPKTYISLMSQYFPAHKAINQPTLNRRITKAEYQNAIDILNKFGLENGWIQPY